MNPDTPIPEAVTRSIERYLADNSGSQPLHALGMTADGRIVRLADHNEHLRPELKRVLEQHIGVLIPPGKGKASSDWIVASTVTCEHQTLESLYAAIRRDSKIREILRDLHSKQAKQLETMHALTTTCDGDEGATRTFGKGEIGKDNKPNWLYKFINKFTQKEWKFVNNAKNGNINPHDLYMSTVITWQYQWAFEKNGWLLALPRTIERCEIENKKTNEVLIEHKADYHSDAFRKAFLETTVNGKSTVRVARALGLKIDRLVVKYCETETSSIDEPIKFDPVNLPFSVLVHVSPDPAVYGST